MPAGTSQPPSMQPADALAERIGTLLRHGLAPRSRAERRAARAVAYGDHLEALLAEIREAKQMSRAPAI